MKIPFYDSLFAYNPFGDDWKTNRDLFRVRRASIDTIDDPGEWDILLMHGWHSLYAPMAKLENELRRQNPTARIWRGSYDSHWKPFSRSAREFKARLRYHKIKPERTLLIGYSMGGLVARSMVAQGFAARGVLCLASPHLGPALHVHFADVGSMSLAGWNYFVRHLNHGRDSDIARRGDYFFQAFTFKDITGFCRHDRIVSTRSELGTGLRGVGRRHVTHLHYDGLAPGPHPHLQGMNPDKIPEALEWVREKLTEH